MLVTENEKRKRNSLEKQRRHGPPAPHPKGRSGPHVTLDGQGSDDANPAAPRFAFRAILSVIPRLNRFAFRIVRAGSSTDEDPATPAARDRRIN